MDIYELMNVSRESVRKCKKILALAESGNTRAQKLVTEIETGNTSVDRAYKEIITQDKQVGLYVKMPHTLRDQLNGLAKQNGVTLNTLVTLVLMAFVEDQ